MNFTKDDAIAYYNSLSDQYDVLDTDTLVDKANPFNKIGTDNDQGIDVARFVAGSQSAGASLLSTDDTATKEVVVENPVVPVVEDTTSEVATD